MKYTVFFIDGAATRSDGYEEVVANTDERALQMAKDVRKYAGKSTRVFCMMSGLKVTKL